MEFVTAGWCTWKDLRVDRAIRNLSCRDLEISLVVIRLGVIGLKLTRFMYLLDLFGGKGRRGGVI